MNFILLILSLSLTVTFSLSLKLNTAKAWPSSSLLKDEVKSSSRSGSNEGNQVEMPSRGAPDTPKGAGTNVRFELPQRGAPGKRRAGAGSRSECQATSEQRLTALIPPTNLGLTVSARPTFWVSVPYTPSSPREIVFKLVDKQANKEVYKTRVTVSGTPGILSVTLPESVNPLAVEKRYQWVFSYLCNPQDASQDIVVHGYVERVNINPEMAARLQRAKTPLEKVTVMADNGIWFDAVTELAYLRRKEPDNKVVLQEWEALLKDVGLEDLVTEPLVNLSQFKLPLRGAPNTAAGASGTTR